MSTMDNVVPPIASAHEAVVKQRVRSRANPIPSYWLGSFIASIVLTLLVGVPSVFHEDTPLDSFHATIVLVVHALVMFPVLAHIVCCYRRYHDLLHPLMIGSLTYMVFQVTFNPIVYGDRMVLATREITTEDAVLAGTVLTSYAVLFVAWCAYYAGLTLLPTRLRGRPPAGTTTLHTQFYVLVGLAFVLLGIAGNIGSLGGVGAYFVKMAHFYEKPQDTGALVEGATKWIILMRFLPVGLYILAFGYYLRHNLTFRRLLLLMAAAVVANVVLSCATGGRGASLATLFFVIFGINHSIKRLTGKALVSILVPIFIVTFVLGQMRGAAYYGTDVQYITPTAISEFGSLYLTNYLGTLCLVDQVDKSGTISGGTAWAGLTGILGGPTPNTTETEVWHRLTGGTVDVNPRYGAPGELYFNYGWIGLIVGMFALGLLLKAISNSYDMSSTHVTMLSTLLGVFAVYTANFLMMANLDYIPQYYLHLSWPYWIAFLLFRYSRC